MANFPLNFPLSSAERFNFLERNAAAPNYEGKWKNARDNYARALPFAVAVSPLPSSAHRSGAREGGWTLRVSRGQILLTHRTPGNWRRSPSIFGALLHSSLPGVQDISTTMDF